MKPRRVRFIGLLGVVASLSVWTFVFVAFKPHPTLPTYQGKTVQEWFFGESGHPGREKTINEARVAFDAMGTNCVPFLLAEVRRRETGFKKFYCWIYPSLPPILRSKLKPPLEPYYTHIVALMHLRHMGSRLDYVANELMAMVPQISDKRTRWQAFWTVEPLAMRLEDARKKKAYFISFLSDLDFRIQLESAVALSRLDSSLTNAIPILITAVTNNNLMVSTFPDPFSSPTTSQASDRQWLAYDALRKVAPKLAERYRIDHKITPKIRATNGSQAIRPETN